MARILVRRRTFEHGEFPPVCCKTGERADVYDSFEFSDTPSWAWILLLFGILPFLIATAFVTERFSGVLPMSQRARNRLRMARRASWVLGLSAVIFGAAGLAAGSRWIYFSGAFGILWLVAITLVWRFSPSANLDGGAVALGNVHRTFIRTIAETAPSMDVELANDDTDPRGI